MMGEYYLLPWAKSGERFSERKRRSNSRARASSVGSSPGSFLRVIPLRSSLASSTPLSTRQQQLTLSCVACQRSRALELRASFIEASEFVQQIAAHARQQMIILERAFCRQRVHHFQPGRRTERHRNRDRAIQINHRRRRNPRERLIERNDPRPIRLLRRTRSRMASRNLGLQNVRALTSRIQLRSLLERRKSATNQKLVPPSAVLLEQ